MLTGLPPYDVTSVGELRSRVMAPDRVPCVMPACPGLCPELAKIVATALAKEPERRFRSVAEMRWRLFLALQGMGAS